MHTHLELLLQVTAGDSIRFKPLTLQEAAALRLRTDSQVGNRMTLSDPPVVCRSLQ